MNPPFGSNMSRSRKFPPDVVKRMQKNELVIKERLKRRDKAAGEAIDSNSIRTFFTPLADRLLNPRRGTLAEVLPATACISASGLAERKFLADRFHVERIITSHDPRHVNFSYKTGIHECLMICRRHSEGNKPPTEFVSLRKMPTNAKEAIDAADAIANGNAERVGAACAGGRQNGSVRATGRLSNGMTTIWPKPYANWKRRRCWSRLGRDTRSGPLAKEYAAPTRLASKASPVP